MNVLRNLVLMMVVFALVSAPVEVGRMDPGLGVNMYGPARHTQELLNRPKSGCELTHPSEMAEYVFSSFSLFT